MATIEGCVVRRQELACTEEEQETYGDKVLLENEVIRIRMKNGTVREKLGDGITALRALPYVDWGVDEVDELLEAVDAHATRLTALEETGMHNSLRISGVETSLGISEPFKEVINTVTYRGAVGIPSGAKRYARIARLYGTHGTMTYNFTDTVTCLPDFPKYLWYGSTVPFNFPPAAQAVVTDTSVDLHLEELEAVAPSFGYDEDNYLYTEGDRWIYHQGGRYTQYEWIDVADIHLAEDEATIKWSVMKGGYFCLLKEPIETDITDLMSNQKPYMDLSVASTGAIGIMNNCYNKTVTTPDFDDSAWTGEQYTLTAGGAYAVIDFEV